MKILPQHSKTAHDGMGLLIFYSSRRQELPDETERLERVTLLPREFNSQGYTLNHNIRMEFFFQTERRSYLKQRPISSSKSGE